MKVLFQNCDGSGWGGAAHQIVMLMEHLKKLGYQTDYSTDTNFNDCDIVHLSHINLMRRIDHTNCHKPMVIKCIWHTYEPRVDNTKASFLAKKAAWLTVESSQELELMMSFLKSELNDNDLKMVRKKTLIFKPGIDPCFKSTKPLHLRKKVHINGWYSHHKGQAEVIKACRALDLPVITAGRPSNVEYINYCRSFKYGEILGPLTKEELCEVYNDSRVYVTASLYESHSGSMCEAVACGCRVVSSSNHLANKEYDKSGYRVYKWGDFDDLKQKISDAYNSSENQENEYWTHERLAHEYDSLFRSLRAKIF